MISGVLNRMGEKVRIFFSGIALLLATAFAALAQSAGPQGTPKGSLNEQVYLVPFGSAVLLHTIVFRPNGDGPFPLVIINHGSPRSAADRPTLTGRFTVASEWFVRRGFAVAVPTRRGYGPTGGGWVEDSGSCNSPDYFTAGRATAEDIRATLVYMREQRFVDPERVVLVGQSAGGWGVLASAGQKFPGVIAIINFAGGRGSRGPDQVCSSYSLVRAANRFGAGAEVPVLSIYTANDSYFNPALARQIHEAFVAGGAQRAKLLQLSAFSQDGHSLFSHRDGPRHWSEHVEAFFRETGLAR